MANTAVYSSIDELNLGVPKRSGGALVAQISESDRLQFSSAASAVPPPLPPPNPKSSHTAALAESRKKQMSNSDESMSQADTVAKVEEEIRLSSSPSQKSLESHSSDQTDGSSISALYATVNKKPPELPPPLNAAQAVTDVDRSEVVSNGVGSEGEMIMFMPPQEEPKSRKAIVLPRTHVYETVPDDLAQNPPVQSRPHSSSISGSGTFRKRTLKKRKSIRREKVKSVLSSAPSNTTPLQQLDPLPASGETMKLNEFVKRFSHYLPLCVRVDEGYCGTEERFVISSGDVYNFHFVKNEKVVSLRDCGENSFSVPLNSAIEFGLLFNPNNDVGAARRGYTFRTVSDLPSTKSCPKILCATQSHVVNDSKCSVQADEILIVSKLTKTHVMKKRVLKAYSLTTKEHKTLQEDCEGHFTTTPECVKLYLPEIIEHFDTSFPLEAMLFVKPDSTEDLPLHLTSDLVTLTHVATETSIIASTCWEDKRQDELSEEDRALVAIPTDLDIEVTFLGRESDSKRLDEATRTLFEQFSSLKITDMKNAGGMQAKGVTNSAQKKLYNAIRNDFPSQGTEIQLPFRLSGIFDGEPSTPGKKSSDPANHVYYTLLPEGVEASPTNSLSNSTSASESKNVQVCPVNGVRNHPCANRADSPTPDFRYQPCALPPEPSSPSRRSMNASYSATNSSSSHSAGFGAINAELDKACAAIDDLYNSNLSELNMSGDSSILSDTKYDYVVTDNPRQCAPIPKPIEHLENNTPPVPMRPRWKESVSDEFEANGSPLISPRMSSPKAIRAKSKSVFISDKVLTPPFEFRGRSSSSGELGSSWKKDGREAYMKFEELSKNYSTLQQEVQELKEELRKTRELQSYSLSTRLQSMRGQNSAPGNASATGATSTRSKSEMKAATMEEQEKNIEELRALSHNEILTLLEAMNLAQYQDNFMKEQVDGEILADCDEGMLEADLHITSAMHRNRLMKIITGKHSAQFITNSSEDKVYSTLDHSYRKKE